MPHASGGQRPDAAKPSTYNALDSPLPQRTVQFPNVTSAVAEKPCSVAKRENGPSLNTPLTYHWKALNWSEAWPPGPDG